MNASRRWRPALALLCTLLLSGCFGERPTQQWEVAVRGLYDAALSADGRYLVAASIEHGGSLWRLPQHERLYNWNHRPGFSLLNAVALSPDGRFAVTGETRTLSLWAVDTGQSLGFWSAPDDILDLALNRDGEYALLGLADHSAVYFNVRQGGIKYHFPHHDKVVAVTLSEDGRLALTGAADGGVKLWSLSDGALLASWRHDNPVRTLALAPNGNLAFSAGQAERAVVRALPDGTELFELPAKDRGYLAGATYTAARFNARGDLLTGTTTRLIQLWRSPDGRLLKRWEASKKDAWRPLQATIIDVAFGTGRNDYLATASNGLIYRLR